METDALFTLRGGDMEIYQFNITILDDDEIENPSIESFVATVQLIGSNVALVVDPLVAAITIVDDDNGKCLGSCDNVLNNHKN